MENYFKGPALHGMNDRIRCWRAWLGGMSNRLTVSRLQSFSIIMVSTTIWSSSSAYFLFGTPLGMPPFLSTNTILYSPNKWRCNSFSRVFLSYVLTKHYKFIIDLGRSSNIKFNKDELDIINEANLFL